METWRKWTLGSFTIEVFKFLLRKMVERHDISYSNVLCGNMFASTYIWSSNHWSKLQGGAKEGFEEFLLSFYFRSGRLIVERYIVSLQMDIIELYFENQRSITDDFLFHKFRFKIVHYEHFLNWFKIMVWVSYFIVKICSLAVTGMYIKKKK